MTMEYPDDDYDQDDYDPEGDGRCEICGAQIIAYVNDLEECSCCYAEGCQKCLNRGDDVFPWLCDECD